MDIQVNGNAEVAARLKAVHESMLDGLGQLSDYFGFSKVIGQIYGALLMSSKPLCLDDIVEQLDISKANVSMNMRTLENYGMVRQVWVRGSSSRRKYYEAETDFWRIITNILKVREMRDVMRALSVLEENGVQLKRALPTLEDEQRETAELYIERMAQMQELFQFAQMIINLVLTRVEDEGVGAGTPNGQIK